MELVFTDDFRFIPKEQFLEENWFRAKCHIRDSYNIPSISFQTWIEPLALVDSRGDRLIFSYDVVLSKDNIKELEFYIGYKYGRIILSAYNACNNSEFQRLKINYYC